MIPPRAVVRHPKSYCRLPVFLSITKVGAALLVAIFLSGASRLVYSYSRGGNSFFFMRQPSDAVLKQQQQQAHSSPFLELHEGIFRQKGKLYPELLLCGKNSNSSFPLLDNISNDPSCLESDTRKYIIQHDNEVERKWKWCAEHGNSTHHQLAIENKVDRLVMFCPRYYYSKYNNNNNNSNRHRWPKRKDQNTTNATTFLLTSPLRTYDPNIYHMMVMRNNVGFHKGRGRDLWCFLDAATRFGEQQQHHQQQNQHIGSSTITTWTLEYNNQTSYSNYAKELFSLLGTTIANDVVEDASDKNASSSKDVPATATHLSLQSPFPGFKFLERRVPLLRTGPIAHSFHFRPNTRPNDALIDISDRVVRRVVESYDYRSMGVADSSSTTLPSPLVLLILRTGNRKIAGIETGTAVEIVEALLEQSLAVRVIDLAQASVLDQILWFSSADIVIGLHGAGLTNLVWMNKHTEVTLIEIAASYGWLRYLDSNLDCQRTQAENPLYMKADYYNLAKRFRVHHELVHPVYSSIGLPGNPIVKEIFYVDAKALAETAKLSIVLKRS